MSAPLPFAGRGRPMAGTLAIGAMLAALAAGCAPNPQPRPLPEPPAPVEAPAPTVTPQPSGSAAPLVPPLDAPAPIPGQAPAGDLSFPVPPNTVVVVPGGSTGVSMPPVHAPVTAQPRGVAPTDPSQYVGATMSVTGRVVQVSNQGGVTSFLLQTPTEGWTVVVPPGVAGPAVASGRTVTVIGYPHRSERNQLLAGSLAP